MTQPIRASASRGQYAVLIAVVSAAALGLVAVSFYAVQRLSKDDCTAVTSIMPDGSQVTTKTCS